MDALPIIISTISLGIAALSFYRTRQNDSHTRRLAAEQKRTDVRTNIIQQRVALSSILNTISALSYSVAQSKHPKADDMLHALEQQKQLFATFVERNETRVAMLDSIAIESTPDTEKLIELERLHAQTQGSLKEALRQADDVRSQAELLTKKITNYSLPNDA